MIASQVATTYRPTLLSIAYRITGEVMTSEDIVQDVLLNWIDRSTERVQDAKAYLAKSVMNASLNYLDRVKRQRELYKGIWLPEPVLTGHHAHTHNYLNDWYILSDTSRLYNCRFAWLS